MKTLRELEVEAYLAGALVMADLYARNEDGSILELKIEQLEEQKLDLQDEVDEFRRIAEDYEEYLTESEAKVHKLNGRIEVLEHAAWRLEQLENKNTKKQKIDVYSRFSEENIEFVSKQDERDVICSILDLEDNLFNKFTNEEKGWYDGCS